jgi:GNAT superfamily N-acetyltransferase
MNNYIIPDYTLDRERKDGYTFMFGTPILTVENPFLNALLKMGGFIIPGRNKVFGIFSLALAEFKIVSPTEVELELLTTPPDERGQGHAKKLMGAIIKAADDTGTTIRLRTANVAHGMMGPTSPIHLIACQKAKKIPAKSLPKFYEKFGFEKCPAFSNIKEGVHMRRLPK